MKKTLLLIVCVLCVFLCACTPYTAHNNAEPESTPAPTDPKPTPGMTIIAPSGTPDVNIDAEDPDDTEQGGNTQGGQSSDPNTGNQPGGEPDDKPVVNPDDMDEEFETPILPG